MKTIVTLLIFSAIFAIGYGHLWDDARVNMAGNGFDILDFGPREAVFVLESEIESDPNIPVLTKTLAKGLQMIDKPSNIFKYYAEVISDNVNIDSSSDVEVGGSAKFWIVKGSFSYRSQVVKQFISKMNHQVTRVYSYVTVADYNLETTGLNVSEGFKYIINQIAEALRKNTPTSIGYAIYLADQLLYLYGTHVIVTIKTGGMISKTDSVDISSFQTNVDQTLSAGADASFSSYFSVNGKITTEDSNEQQYNSAVTDTYIESFGGDSWKMNNFTYDNWVDSVPVKPAIIGLRLIYVLDVITGQHFPHLSSTDLFNVRALVDKRVDVYLKNNYYLGCPITTASNYVSYANSFDPSLCNYQTAFHFGGLFTVSDNPSFSVPNILTQTLNCPPGFDTYPLLTLTLQADAGTNCPWFARDFPNYWSKFCFHYYNTFTATTYSCLSSANQTTGVYFGGIYTSSVPNDITQAQSCPQKYIGFPIYHDVAQLVVSTVCMAQYDVGAIVAVPFGGIFSSQNPNYLTGSPTCAGNYERHSVGPDPIAELSYCIGLGSLNDVQKDIIPPGYGNNLNQMLDYFSIHQFENGTQIGLQMDPLSNMSYYDQIISIWNNLTKLKTGLEENGYELFSEESMKNGYNYLKQWIESNKLIYQSDEIMLMLQNDKIATKRNVGAIASGIIVPIVTVMTTVILVILYLRRRRRYKNKSQYSIIQ